MATTVTTKKAPPPTKEVTQQRNSIAEWTVTFLLLLFGTSTIAQPFVIPTSSMHNTLMTGDHLIVDKLAYAPPGALSKHLLPYTEVKRGDIIVFRHPILLKEDYVKRVIGIPGDHIKLVNRVVYLNGKPQNEPYVIHIQRDPDPYRDNFPVGSPELQSSQEMIDRASEMLRDHVTNGELVVPPGNYFAMGDNRDNSLDSRYWGLVPRENITGKPVIVFWSYDAPTEDLKDYNLHHFVDLMQHFFTKTRWDRTMRFVHGTPSS
ncbi:MAG: signal peptidase I [Acidobacteriota bacterium]|nr:signal peptidase I [Acidobacteriota bacterium]